VASSRLALAGLLLFGVAFARYLAQRSHEAEVKKALSVLIDQLEEKPIRKTQPHMEGDAAVLEFSRSYSSPSRLCGCRLPDMDRSEHSVTVNVLQPLTLIRRPHGSGPSGRPPCRYHQVQPVVKEQEDPCHLWAGSHVRAGHPTRAAFS
jgi:hypothetical protein